MTRWEYRLLTYKGWTSPKLKQKHEDELNALGQEGWELVSMAAESTSVTLVFKRPVEDGRSSARRRRSDWPSW